MYGRRDIVVDADMLDWILDLELGIQISRKASTLGRRHCRQAYIGGVGGDY